MGAPAGRPSRPDLRRVSGEVHRPRNAGRRREDLIRIKASWIIAGGRTSPRHGRAISRARRRLVAVRSRLSSRSRRAAPWPAGCARSIFDARYRPASGRPPFFEPDLFERLRPLFPSLLRVSLFGLGEPTLNRHLVEYVRELSAAGVEVAFNTN